MWLNNAYLLQKPRVLSALTRLHVISINFCWFATFTTWELSFEMVALNLSVESVVLLCVCLSMVKVSATAVRPSRTSIVSPRIGVITLMLAFCLMLRNHFHLYGHNFVIAISYLISAFFPYMIKPSKHRRSYEGHEMRNWNDRLITTSSAYIMCAAFAVWYGQFEIGVICFVTYIGSSLYHRHREMEYFNLDNIFATSLLMVFNYGLISSYHTHEIYFTLAAIGLPTAVFLIVYCGMPADIRKKGTSGSDLLCCIRTGRELYDTVHTLWHLASSVGPAMAVWYFDYVQNSDPSLHTSEWSRIDDFIIKNLPVIALSIAVTMNIMGNIHGIVPLE